MLKLYNTLSKKIEEFKPLNDNKVTMYTCGPTVYDHMHIGNLRTFLFADILYRVLVTNDYQVTNVQNITDIDDKIIKRATERGISIQELADEYTKYFLEDLSRLNIITVNVQPKATEHIGKMIKYIEELIEKGFAYVEKDGSVYFDISKFPSYGRLSGLDRRELKTGTRILSDEYTKEDVQDFALWKSVGLDEVGWDSPWGKGRPGWHIECSVMSQEYLGETLDIHAGGIDLMFPHHENEIAQSESKTGKPFVNFFIHGEHILVDGKKMSKSLKNFYTLQDVINKGYDPISYRYLILTAHYRDRLNFTWKSLEGAQNTLNNIREEIRGWIQDVEPSNGLSQEDNQAVKQIWQNFLSAANQDLNIPQAVVFLHELLKVNAPISSKSQIILKMDKILGLELDKYVGKPLEVSESVQKLAEEREKARQSKDFAKADELRKEVEKLGYEIEDKASGYQIKKLH